MIKKFRCMQFNLENFFIFIDKELPNHWPDISEDLWQTLTHSTVKLKSLKKIKKISCLINEQNPDIMILNEVGGKESLENFNRLFLNENYKVELIEGNSDRGIDIGYLIKKDLNLNFLLISHKERPLNFIYPHEDVNIKKTHYFSRDVAELRIFNKLQDQSPCMVILAVHLKSKLDRDGIDPEGRSRRQAELKTLLEIYKEVKRETRDQVPILIGGDFNGIAHSKKCEIEFTPIYSETDLNDVMELMDVPEENRYTQIIFNSLNQAHRVQIDYFFIDKKYKKLIHSAYTHRFKDEGGIEIMPPIKLEQRLSLPSDHYPIVCDLFFNDIE